VKKSEMKRTRVPRGHLRKKKPTMHLQLSSKTKDSVRKEKKRDVGPTDKMNDTA